MNKKIICKLEVVLSIFIVLISIATIVSAKYDASLVMKSESKLIENEEVIVTTSIQATDIGSGIDTIIMKLNYDKSVFESLSKENMTVGSNWTLSYAESTNMITLTRNAKITKSEEIFTINFKVKPVINEESTLIKINEIDIAGLNAQNISDSVNIKQEEATIEINRNGNSQIINAMSDDQVKSNDLEMNSIIYIVIAFVILGVAIGLGFVSYKKIFKNKI